VRVDDVQVELRADRVTISRGDVPIAFGRWHSGRIVERSGSVPPSSDLWGRIERAVTRESQRDVEAAFAAAYDARGVDVTQIEGMLALSPRERLRLLEAQCREVLRLLGHGPAD
jgi:hypothetical protein